MFSPTLRKTANFKLAAQGDQKCRWVLFSFWENILGRRSRDIKNTTNNDTYSSKRAPSISTSKFF